MQLRLPHHFERDMVDDALPHSDTREVIDILRVASSWQEYHPLCLLQTDAEELKLLDGPVARHHRRQEHNQWNRYI